MRGVGRLSGWFVVAAVFLAVVNFKAICPTKVLFCAIRATSKNKTKFGCDIFKLTKKPNRKLTKTKPRFCKNQICFPALLNAVF